MLTAVVMAGGSGTRFWPLSRESLPKQFLRLHGDRTLLQQTVDRIVDLVGASGVTVVTNKAHVDRTRRDLPQTPAENIVGEPVGRDTAACIALAAELCVRRDPIGRMVVLAADHVIEPTERFHAAIRAAERHLDAHPEALVTFGVAPTYPATGYGYLRRGPLAGAYDGIRVYALEGFQEKPDAERARRYVESGESFWNSGVFVWNAAAVLDEIDRQIPSVREGVRRIADAWFTKERDAVFAREYAAMEKKSIDYAVMENARSVAMVEAPFQWDDVGSWLALERVRRPDREGNVVVGNHVGVDTTGCVVVGDGRHVIGTLGVKDLIVVHTPDATLVADRKNEQDVKRLYQELARRGFGEFQ